jgi:hypothetical protein
MSSEPRHVRAPANGAGRRHPGICISDTREEAAL